MNENDKWIIMPKCPKCRKILKAPTDKKKTSLKCKCGNIVIVYDHDYKDNK